MIPLEIKALDKSHWPAVSKIYADGLETKIASFETTCPSWEDWDMNHHKFCRFVICEDKNAIGWIALVPVSNRKVYAGVAEVSIYISKESQGKGVGKMLMSHLLNEVEKYGIYTLQCSLFPENRVSYALHSAFGFREIGYREKVAKLENEWRNTILMERRSKSEEFN